MNNFHYDKLSEKFDKISDKIIKNIIEAQRETAEIVCNDVKELAPKGETGKYAQSIKVGETNVTRDKITTQIYTEAKVVSTKGKEYNLGYLLETGTSPHLIEPVFAQALHFVINGEDIFAKLVHHPGTIAQPHFSTGLYMNRLIYKQKLNKAIIDSFK